MRRRKREGLVAVTDPDAASKRGLIERAYTLGASLGLAVWCEDEAGPFQAVPHPGGAWRPCGHPATRPHEHVRGGTCKLPALFHSATGQVHLQPVGSCTNPVLHGWLKERLTAIVAALPTCAEPAPTRRRPVPRGRHGRTGWRNSSAPRDERPRHAAVLRPGGHDPPPGGRSVDRDARRADHLGPAPALVSAGPAPR